MSSGRGRGRAADLIGSIVRDPREAARRVPAALRAFVDEFPPGHYHSPVPSRATVAVLDRNRWERDPAGVDLRDAEQLALARALAAHPFADLTGTARARYRIENPFFAHGDGIVLQALLRHLRPQRYVEIGSGWSSALVLDVDDRFLDRSLECTFVEPYPERLQQLISGGDASRVTLLDKPLIEVVDQVVGTLGAGDVLFIDSSHVVGPGSDVNQLLLEVVPALPAGVHVHVHDVYFPFEYPPAWLSGGRYWSEAYLLHALLIGNASLEITFWSSYLAARRRAEVAALLPGWDADPGGSIWLVTR